MFRFTIVLAVFGLLLSACSEPVGGPSIAMMNVHQTNFDASDSLADEADTDSAEREDIESDLPLLGSPDIEEALDALQEAETEVSPDAAEAEIVETECGCENFEKSFCTDGVWSHVYYGCDADGVCRILQSANGLCPGECDGDVCAKPECAIDADCDDANACTLDVCGNGICANEAIDADCDDGDTCTVNDACLAGACTGTVLPDTDGDGVCDEEDSCDFDDQNIDGACSSVIMCWGTAGCSQPPFYPPVWSYEDWTDQPPACEITAGVPSVSLPTAADCCVSPKAMTGSPCLYDKHGQFGLPGGNFNAYELFGP